MYVYLLYIVCEDLNNTNNNNKASGRQMANHSLG